MSCRQAWPKDRYLPDDVFGQASGPHAASPRSLKTFLPNVPAAVHLLRALEKAGGNEVASARILHLEDLTALAVIASDWIIEPAAGIPSHSCKSDNWYDRQCNHPEHSVLLCGVVMVSLDVV
jgi:hypothetical protein